MQNTKTIANTDGSSPTQTSEMPTATIPPMLSEEEKAGAPHAQYVEIKTTNQDGCYPLNAKKP